MTTNQARNHHWVPQCYLKGFAKSPSKNAKLYVVDKTSRTSFMASPRNVASARDFNRVDAKGVAPDHVESGYARFESLVAPALRNMSQRYGFGSGGDQNLVLNLIALLAVRTPRMRENVRSFHDQIARKVMSLNVATRERYEASFGRAAEDGYIDKNELVSYEAMKDFVVRGEYNINVGTTHHVANELELAEAVLPLLAKRTWTFIRAGSGTGGFVTSDHPVALQWTELKPRGFHSSPGFGLRGTEVLFPVSHDLLMVGEFGGSGGLLEANREQVAFANSALIFHATRQVYARDDKFIYQRYDGELRRGDDLVKDLQAQP
ncbi:DUF4238 domain-containing protein [Noviherbaspirillum malthae]|uniref:DUF4238 domain-containing protein n=1 Tax=Noviherbaspirillum malthae TaxID=1260987 RepID=UPI00188DCA96|nr:DUF4238 domain-containing protein [Noviherbaspirillum malthae]